MPRLLMMYRARKLPLVFQLATVLLLACSASLAQTSKPDGQDIAFTVSMSKPQTHLLEVEMRIREVPGEAAILVMQVWTPGSYVVGEFELHVQVFGEGGQLGHSL